MACDTLYADSTVSEYCGHCLLYLKPFLEGLETGFIQVGDLRRQHVPRFGYRLEKRSRNAKKTKSSLGFSIFISKLSRVQPLDEDIELQDNAGLVIQSLRNTAASDAEHHEWDAHSRSHILRATTLTIEERYGENCSLLASPSAQFAPHPLLEESK